MRSRLLPLAAVAAAALAIAASTTSVAGAATHGGAVPTHQGTAQVKAAVHPNAICYTQLTAGSGIGVVSQKFGPGFNMYNSRAADDFVTTLATTCPAVSIDVPGMYFNGTGPAPRVQVRFYFDSSGIPGAIYKTRNVPATAAGFTDTLGTFHVPWLNPVVLQPSTTYWVSVRVRMNFSPGGEWGWETRSPQIGNFAVWENPGGAFGTGCPTWQPLATCFAAGTGDDLMFAIND
jgi:hypothetical protein